MPISTTISQTFQSIGGTFSSTRTVVSNASDTYNLACTPAQPGALSTRTNNTDGSLTMTSASHGITTGARLDVYWTDTAGNVYCAYGATVGTVAGTTVPFTGATTSVAGVTNVQVLPTQGTTVLAAVPVTAAVVVVGNNLQAMAVGASAPGLHVFRTSAPADAAVYLIGVSAGSSTWDVGSGAANPLAGKTTATVCCSSYLQGSAATLNGTLKYN